MCEKGRYKERERERERVVFKKETCTVKVSTDSLIGDAIYLLHYN